MATRELHADGAAVLNSTLTVAGNATVSGTLSVAGVGNISTALSGKQAALTASSALSVASVTTSAYSTLNGLRVSGGGGAAGTGANLRVTGTGDLVNNPSGLYFGGTSVDTHLLELSWVGLCHFYRANASTAWTQSLGISNAGYCTFYRGYGSSSDRSLKGDPQDASTEDALNMLRQVSAKTYQRLDMPDEDGPRLGFIAQDIEASCPSAWSNLVGTTQYQWSGNPEGGDIRTLDYARLICPLWQSCRSMLARIEMLEERVAQLSASQ